MGPGGVPYTVAWNRQGVHFEDRGTGDPIYDVNLICVNADQLPGFVERMGPAFFSDRHNIAMWWWEVERFPESMASAASLVDEVWVGSRHAGDAIARDHVSVRQLAMRVRFEREVDRGIDENLARRRRRIAGGREL